MATSNLPVVLQTPDMLALEKEIQNRRNEKYNNYPIPFPTFQPTNLKTIEANLTIIASNEAKISNYNEKLIPEAQQDYAVKNGDYNSAMKSGTGVCQATAVGKIITLGINQKNEKCQHEKRLASDGAKATLNGYITSRDTLITTNKRLNSDNQGFIKQNLDLLAGVKNEADAWLEKAKKWVDDEQAQTTKTAQSTVTNQLILTNGLTDVTERNVKLWEDAGKVGAIITPDGKVVQDTSKMQNNIFLGIGALILVGLGIWAFKS